MARFSTKQMVGMFLTGAAAGVAVALMYAPKSGAQTRKDIRKFSRKTLNQIDDLQNEVREQVGSGYQQMLELFDNVKEYVEDSKNRLQKLMRIA